jgi:type IV secretory pathway VirB2 component (pilin)
MKKIFFISLFFLFFGLAPHVFASGASGSFDTVNSGFTALAPIPGLTDQANTSVVNSTSLTNFFNNLYKYLIGIAAILAVIEIIWAGFNIATNKDNVSVLMSSKSKISQAILGLVLVLSPVLVFSIINPSILNLSLNLPALNTASGTWSPTETEIQSSTAVDATTGCTVSGVKGILQIAICPDAFAWIQKNCADGSAKSMVYPLTKTADGTKATFAIMCSWAKYVFIDTRTSSLTTPISGLQPLEKTPDNPDNGVSAIQFANICRDANIGADTCISDMPTFTFATDCPPTTTDIPVKATGKCYKEKLTCDLHALSSSVINWTAKCSSYPHWTLFK